MDVKGIITNLIIIWFCSDVTMQWVGHGHVQHKVLLEIIILQAVVLPNDARMTVYYCIVTISISKKAVSTLCCVHTMLLLLLSAIALSFLMITTLSTHAQIPTDLPH